MSSAMPSGGHACGNPDNCLSCRPHNEGREEGFLVGPADERAARGADGSMPDGRAVVGIWRPLRHRRRSQRDESDTHRRHSHCMHHGPALARPCRREQQGWRVLCLGGLNVARYVHDDVVRTLPHVLPRPRDGFSADGMPCGFRQVPPEFGRGCCQVCAHRHFLERRHALRHIVHLRRRRHALF